MSMPWDMQDGGPQRWGQDARHDEGAEGRWEDHRCQILLDATLRRRWLLLFDRNQPKRALKLNPPAAPSASLSPFLPFSISLFLHFSISPFLLPHPPSDFLFHYFCRFLLKRINPRHLSPIKKRQTNKQTNKAIVFDYYYLFMIIWNFIQSISYIHWIQLCTLIRQIWTLISIIIKKRSNQCRRWFNLLRLISLCCYPTALSQWMLSFRFLLIEKQACYQSVPCIHWISLCQLICRVFELE